MGSQIKTTVYLDAADYAELKSAARRQGRTAAELVREAVAQYAARTRQPDDFPRCIGASSSGIPDLGERDEEYLEGFGED